LKNWLPDFCLFAVGKATAMSIFGKTPASRIKDIDALLQILDLLPTSIFVKDENLNFVFSNEAHCKIIGSEAEKLLGLSDADFYPKDQAKRFMEADRSVLNSPEPKEFMELATSTDGSTVYSLTRKARVITSDGATYLVGTNTNVTGMKSYEAELEAKEARYRALAETVPVGIWHLHENGNTVYVNPFLLAILGMTEAEFAVTDPKDMLAFSADKGIADMIGAASRFETDLMSRGRVVARAMVVSSGWLDNAGVAGRSVIVTFVDVTKISDLQTVNDQVTRLNLELSDNIKKLKATQEEMVKAGRMAQLGQLTATVAHELRNPLAAVRTSAFVLDRKIKGKGMGVEQQLQRIDKGIVRCDNIISQLLDFARTRPVQRKLLDLDTWLAKVIEEEAAKLPAVVTIECTLGLGGLVAAIDPERMSRCLINLVSNASEALVGRGDDLSGGADFFPKIIIKSSRTGHGIEISVTDNGPGISAENLLRIKEPLFTTKSFGTGLGLPAVEKILEQHSGGLEIASKPGEGACFTAWFPIIETLEEAA
jgi:PAS domain S-box-containing protein